MTAGNEAVSGDHNFTTNTTTDTTAPAISNITTSYITTTTATISWTTNKAATSQIDYGTTPGYGSSTNLDARLVNNHSVNLTGLTANTNYHYRVKSKDAAGNEAISVDHSFYSLADIDIGKIVFCSTRDGNQEIYIMNADGTNQTRLTFNTADDSNPQLSSDGRKIVFDSDRDGNEEIYVMNVDGSNQTRITNNTFVDVQPAWSPDGTKIAFSSACSGTPQIWVMNVDGSDATVQLHPSYDSPMGRFYTSLVCRWTRIVYENGSGKPLVVYT